jgi:hypothetical protein
VHDYYGSRFNHPKASNLNLSLHQIFPRFDIQLPDKQAIMASQGGNDSINVPSVSTASTTSSFAPALPTPTSTPNAVIVTSIITPSFTTSTTSQATVAATPSQTVPQTLTQPSSSPSPKGTSPDLIAGVAVAAAVGGALLAFLLTFFLMRSRSRKRSNRYRHGERHENVKGADVTVTELSESATPAAYRWEKYLPQSEDDSSLRLRIKTLLHQIELHVETFYTTPSTPVKINQDLQLQLLKVDSPHLPQPLASMLPHMKDPTLLIKHCLAHMIVSKITDGGVNTGSLLPSDFTSLPQAMYMAKRNSKKPGKSTSVPYIILGHLLNSYSAFHQALSRWRVLTSYLRPDTTDDQAYIGYRDANIQTAADTFCTSFSLWANPRYNNAARHQHLVEIMKAAAETGIVVFSQPTTFAYLWVVPTSARYSGVRFVVTPGFAKVADENALVLESPFIMVPHVLHGG